MALKRHVTASLPWSKSMPMGLPAPVLRAYLPSMLSRTVFAKYMIPAKTQNQLSIAPSASSPYSAYMARTDTKTHKKPVIVITFGANVHGNFETRKSQRGLWKCK